MILKFHDLPHNPAQRETVLRAHLPAVRSKGDVVVLGSLDGWPRAAVFDLDGTLVPCEFVDTLAAARGVAHLVRPLTSRAMAGDDDFRENYSARIALLAGTPVAQIEHLVDSVPLAPGAAKLIDTLHSAGCRTAIITGGYARLGRAIQTRLGIDSLYATELEEVDGALTGRTAGKILDEAGKVAALEDFCARYGYTPLEAMAVGDGANDIKMLAAAGVAVLTKSLNAILVE